jgi:hypothetical protein
VLRCHCSLPPPLPPLLHKKLPVAEEALDCIVFWPCHQPQCSPAVGAEAFAPHQTELPVMSLLLGDHTLAGLKAAAVEPDLPALLQRALSTTTGHSNEKGQWQADNRTRWWRGAHISQPATPTCCRGKLTVSGLLSSLHPVSLSLCVHSDRRCSKDGLRCHPDAGVGSCTQRRVGRRRLVSSFALSACLPACPRRITSPSSFALPVAGCSDVLTCMRCRR